MHFAESFDRFRRPTGTNLAETQRAQMAERKLLQIGQKLTAREAEILKMEEKLEQGSALLKKLKQTIPTTHTIMKMWKVAHQCLKVIVTRYLFHVKFMMIDSD